MSQDTTNVTTQVAAPADANTTPVFRPRIDVFEHADHYLLRVDVPGARADAVDLCFENGVLTLHAPVTPSRAPLPADEYLQGDWRVAVRFDDLVEADGIEARQALGVLELRLPKSAARRQRRIDVRVN